MMLDVKGRLSVCVYVCLFNVLGTIWGPTDKILFMQIHLDYVKKLLLREKQLSKTNLPHAFASHLVKKSETEQVC